MTDFLIRVAKASDAAAIRDIYTPFVKDTAITFEVDVPTEADFQERILSTLEMYPYLAAEFEGELIGYAYAARQMERAAYQWNATLSVYLGRQLGRGIGSALYRTLMDILKLQNIHNVYGGITSPNPASEALHSKLGFTLLGRYKQTGFKAGQWHDVVWYEKRLTDEEEALVSLLPPSPPIPFSELDGRLVESVLSSYGHF